MGIYLDYNATTPIAPAVREAMTPFLYAEYGNPSSGHALGRFAHDAMEAARARVAALLGARADEIYFTGGGTEANNLAIKGLAFPRLAKWLADGRRGSPGHFVLSAFEHPAVVAPVEFLRSLGFEATVVRVSGEGLIDPGDVAAAIRDDTFLVSVMHANNEVGTIQPIADIARVCRERGVLLHTDAAQSVGKIATQVRELGVDLLTIAGHKLYVSKGVGALYVRRGVTLAPAMHGAGHERGLRPGTENVAFCVALGAAAEIARTSLDENGVRMARLRDRLYERLVAATGRQLAINGGRAARLPNTLSVNFPGVRGADVLESAGDVWASTGSACHSGATQLSTSLAAMGVSPDEGAGCVRLSLGWYTTVEEVDAAAEMLAAAWRQLAR